MRGAKRDRKADKDYHADLFEQQRRNDGYQDALEKLTARRCLAFLDSCVTTHEAESDWGQPCAIRAQRRMNQHAVILVGVATAVYQCQMQAFKIFTR